MICTWKHAWSCRMRNEKRFLSWKIDYLRCTEDLPSFPEILFSKTFYLRENIPTRSFNVLKIIAKQTHVLAKDTLMDF